MRLIISILGLFIGMLGILFVVISLGKNLNVTKNFDVAATGFIMLGIALIIALLVGILNEIKKRKQ